MDLEELSIQLYDSANEVKLIDMVNRLYREDPGGEQMTDEKVIGTANFLFENPKFGRILTIHSGQKIIGYSILINYWSNEYGGLITFLDELFIIPEYRNRKIGTCFIEHLVSASKKIAKGIMLEVHPENGHALRFYQRQGFTGIDNRFLQLLF